MLKVKLFTEDAILPTRTHPSDAGLDLYATEDVSITYGAKQRINTHVGIALPEATVGLIQDRSSMGNNGVRVLGGVIDANYRGEIQVVLAYVAHPQASDGSFALGYDRVEIKRGDKIAQLIIVPVFTPEVVEVFSFEDTDRGDKGFGSSGR